MFGALSPELSRFGWHTSPGYDSGHMKELPADLADPLHILGPIPWQTLAWLALLAFLIALWWLWRKFRSQEPATPSPPAPPAPAPGGTGIASVIDEIQQRFVDVDPRHGCHELSEALRSHYERQSGHRLSTATVGEIVSSIGDSAVSRFFKLLADLQFGRAEPSADDFNGACEVAKDVVSVKGAWKP